MAHKLTVELNDAQWSILQERAENRDGDPEDTAELAADLVHVWHGRVKALMKYARKLTKEDATFRPYVPLGFEDKQREKIKAAAIAEGIAPKPGKNGAHPKAKEAPKPAKAKARKVSKAQTALPLEGAARAS